MEFPAKDVDGKSFVLRMANRSPASSVGGKPIDNEAQLDRVFTWCGKKVAKKEQDAIVALEKQEEQQKQREQERQEKSRKKVRHPRAHAHDTHIHIHTRTNCLLSL